MIRAVLNINTAPLVILHCAYTNNPGKIERNPVTINSIPNDINNNPIIRVTTLIPV